MRTSFFEGFSFRLGHAQFPIICLLTMAARFGPMTFLLLVLSLFSAVRADISDSWNDYLRDKVLTVLDSGPRHRRDVKQPPQALVNFENCGQDDDIFTVLNVSVYPNPVKFPGEMNVSYTLSVKEDVHGPVKIEMTMSKKISLLFGLTSWFDIPCLDHRFGTCTFEDGCNNEIIKEGLCRNAVGGDGEDICGCPFLKGNYTSKSVSYKVPAFPKDIPVYLLQGEFLVKVIMTKDDLNLACYEASFYLEV